MMSIDRRYRVCPIPLFEFEESDWDLLLASNRVDDLKQRLKTLDILQYFFPPGDQVVLGLVDRGVSNPVTVKETLDAAVKLGHPLSENEIVPTISNFAETLDALKDSGHLVEGEYGLEVTPEGATVRANVKVRPKESLISKVLNRMSINVSASPKDLLGP